MYSSRHSGVHKHFPSLGSQYRNVSQCVVSQVMSYAVTAKIGPNRDVLSYESLNIF
jgi:hypothetical protein